MLNTFVVFGEFEIAMGTCRNYTTLTFDPLGQVRVALWGKLYVCVCVKGICAETDAGESRLRSGHCVRRPARPVVTLSLMHAPTDRAFLQRFLYARESNGF